VKVDSFVVDTQIAGSQEEICPRMELVQEVEDQHRKVQGPGYL
jgi:hypothetical protein